MARKKDIEIQVNGFLKELEKNNVPVSQAILFGSMVKGKSHQYSDIDLAVWSPAFNQNFNDNILKSLPAKRKYLNIELHPFPEDEDENINPFIDEIKKTGILILPNVIHSVNGFQFPHGF